MLFSIQIFFLTCIFIQQYNIKGDTSLCSDSANWGTSEQNHKKLVQLFEDEIKPKLEIGHNFIIHSKGTHNLKFINWEDQILRLVCPDTKIGEEVKEWKHRYFLENHEKAKNKEKEFNEAKYYSWQLIVETPLRFEYFTTYSCQTKSNCWHHFYIITKPSPRTTKHVQVASGSNVTFSCWGRNRTTEDKKIEYPINMPYQNIIWKFPNGGRAPENFDFNITFTNKTVNEKGEISMWENIASITNASEFNAGIHECVIVDKFGVFSTPEFYEGVYLFSGKRYKGFLHVHVRPNSYILFPAGILVGLCCILPLMVKFCPTAINEADLEEEDDSKEHMDTTPSTLILTEDDAKIDSNEIS